MIKQFLMQCLTHPWAMLEAALPDLLARAGKGDQPRAESRGGGFQRLERLAIIPIHGVILPRADEMSEFLGITTNDSIREAVIAAAADPAIDAIVLDVDSPGGSALGNMETGDAIFEARQQKPVIAVVGSMGASAAYWLASQASEVVVSPGGMGVGSIGTWMAHSDFSKQLEQEGEKVTLIYAGKFKTEGNPFEPLTDAARADLQAKADAHQADFVAAVARGRKRTPAEVETRFGEGRMVLPREAVARGMADRVGTMRQTLVRLLRGRESGAPAFGTLREYEAFLREEGGVSRKTATDLAAGGYQAAFPAQPGADQAKVEDAELRDALLGFSEAINPHKEG